MDSPTSSVDVALEVVKNGWSKLRESPVKDADGPDQERNKLLKEFEDKAKREGLGIWASASSQPVRHSITPLVDFYSVTEVVVSLPDHLELGGELCDA